MCRRRPSLSLRLLPCLGALLLGLPAPAMGWQSLTSQEGVPLRWYQSQIDYTPGLPGPSLPAGQDEGLSAAIQAAFDRWQAVECDLCFAEQGPSCPPEPCARHPLGLRFSARAPATVGTPCVLGLSAEPGCALDGRDPGALVFIRDPADWPFGSGLLALTLVSHRAEVGAIEAAAVLFNDAHHAFCLGPCGGARQHLPSVLTHEIGHVLGLDHSDLPGAAMGGALGWGDQGPASLSEDDRSGICHLYRVDARPQAAGPCAEGSEDRGCDGGPRQGHAAALLCLLLCVSGGLWGRRGGRGLAGGALVALICWPSPAHAFKQATAKSGAHMRWYAGNIPYTIDKDALSTEGIGQAQLRQITADSFAAWQAVPCELCHDPNGLACEPVACKAHPLGLSFAFKGFAEKLPMGLGCADGSPPPAGCAPDPAALAACEGAPNGNQITVVREAEQWCFGSHTIAMTLVSANEVSGEIADADILLNAAWKVFCAGDCVASGWDLQNTLTHEIGHFIGLDHSAAPEATMFGGAAAGETSKRSLEDDDVQGVCRSYRQAWQAQGCPPVEDTCCQAGAPGASHNPAPGALAALLLAWALLMARRKTPRVRQSGVRSRG